MTFIKHVVSLIILYFMFPSGAFCQQEQLCCTVIDINKDSGTVMIRNTNEGWIKSFKPAALEFAELRIGDSVDAAIIINQVSRLKGVPKTYPMFQPELGLPCCEVSRIAGDSTSFTIIARKHTGDTLMFNTPDSLAAAVTVGYKVYTSARHGYAMMVSPLRKDTLFLAFPILPVAED